MSQNTKGVGIHGPMRRWENDIEARLAALESRPHYVIDHYELNGQYWHHVWDRTTPDDPRLVGVIGPAVGFQPDTLPEPPAAEAVVPWRVYEAPGRAYTHWFTDGTNWYGCPSGESNWRATDRLTHPDKILDIAAGNADPWPVAPGSKAGDRVIGKEEALPEGWEIDYDDTLGWRATGFTSPAMSYADDARATLAIEHATSEADARVRLIAHLERVAK